MVLIISNELILKNKAPEARDIGNYAKIFILLLKYPLLHQANVLVHLLCHVTYVTAFNTCFALVVKPANEKYLFNINWSNQKKRITYLLC